ncbi:MAG TPA: efflux RND transporter periplasmic adaptor subunit [Leptolyngbyaceae cyanobacterium M65_K2018_010]|nr:efflux RND transporter periplasmic adaptor subunit [Leptolyngbyaceae cyanobacterium M65_K2018_010]
MEVPGFGKIRPPWAWLVGGVLAALVATGAVGYGLWRSRLESYDLEAFTTAATVQPLTVRITASGTVRPVQTVNLSPENAGIVAELYVEQGDRVEAGQWIARMKSDAIEAQVEQNQAAVAEATAALEDLRRGSRPEEIAQAEAAVVAAQAQVRDAQARLALATNEYSRSQRLFERGGISQTELDNAQREQRSAQAGLDQAQARVIETQRRVDDLRNLPQPEAIAQAEARLAQTRAQLRGTQVRLEENLIRAPFAGIITQKYASVGAFVTPTTTASEASSATSTAIVALAADLEVLAEVPEADIGLVELGQRVEIVADAFPEETFAGQVKRVAPEAIERQNVTLFQVRIELLSGKELLRSNMNVNVAFIGDQLTDALVVPTVAVVTQAGQTGVLVPGERRDIVFQPVTLGPQVGDQIQILSGLQAGDRVFVDLPPGKSLDTITVRQER